jgi:hypothetical protein
VNRRGDPSKSGSDAPCGPRKGAAHQPMWARLSTTSFGGRNRLGSSVVPGASLGTGPPPRAWSTSLIAYACRPQQLATLLPVTPSRRPTTAVPVTPPVSPHPMVTWAKDAFRLPHDRLTLVVMASSMSPSVILTSVYAALADLNWRTAIE